jgi:aryl hydrocarbon receptor nuclear translocator
MWTWPGAGQATESTGPVTSTGAVQGTAPQQHELTDMLQMLDQTGATSFEDLNMFNTGFE